MRILLAVSADVATALRACLVRAGFSCDLASGLAGARDNLARTSYAALVVARALPDGDGLDIVRGLRLAGRTLPVLVCDPGAAVMTRILGLDAGADDYLAQPVAPEEIAARLRALLRRVPEQGDGAISCGALTFDAEARRAQVAGHPVDLTGREAELLGLLLRRRGRIVARSLIEDQLFGAHGMIGSNAVEVCIHRLRHKLRTAGDAVRISTVKGLGYRLHAP